MSVTSLITHFLAYAAGMATVWLLCIVIAGGRADDWADEMAERRGPQRRAPEGGAKDPVGVASGEGQQTAPGVTPASSHPGREEETA